MPRTQTAALNDRSFWRRLLAVAHPDRNGGDHELFVFLTALQEHILECATLEPVLDSSRRREGSTWRPTQQDQGQDRVPFDPDLGVADEHLMLTHRALSIAQTLEEPLRSLLLLLLDHDTTDHGRDALRQMRGASYKQIAYGAHLAGLPSEERSRLYEVARSIPLSESHASHIINELKKHQAAA
jgi:hypothetical protein